MYCTTLKKKLYIIFVDLGGESMNSNDVKFIKQELVRVDKEFGPKTINVKYFKYPDIEFQSAIRDAQEYLTNLIRALNGVNRDISYQGLIHLSKLGWEDQKPFDIDTKTYRCRYLTLLLTEIVNNLGTLCEKLYRYYSPGVGIYEHGYFYLMEVQNTLRDFIDRFMNGNHWRTEIEKILMHTYLLRTNKQSKAVNMIDGTKKVLAELRDGCHKAPFVKPLLDTEMQLTYLFQAVEFLCLGNGHCEDIPKRKEYKHKVPGKDDFKYEIAYLGKVLMANDFRKLALAFQIFEDSMPKTHYGIKEVRTNPYLALGCEALEFTGFILNDACCSELIDLLLERKGWSC